MATLTVWKFDTAEGAQGALNKLVDLSKQQLIQVQDAAIVSWPAGKKKPNTSNHGSLTGAGALSGAFWGMLFGLIFFVPSSAWRSAAHGALSGKFADYGINDNFIKEVRRGDRGYVGALPAHQRCGTRPHRRGLQGRFP